MKRQISTKVQKKWRYEIIGNRTALNKAKTPYRIFGFKTPRHEQYETMQWTKQFTKMKYERHEHTAVLLNILNKIFFKVVKFKSSVGRRSYVRLIEDFRIIAIIWVDSQYLGIILIGSTLCIENL